MPGMRIGDYKVEIDGTGDVEITVEWTTAWGRTEEQFVWLTFEDVSDLYRAAKEKRS